MPITRDGHIVTVQQHIQEAQKDFPTATGEFSWLLSAVTLSTKMISSYVRRAGLFDIWGDAGTTNIQGEEVKKLDLIANDTLKRTFGYRGSVGIIASEEDDEPRVIEDVQEGGQYIVMFDPLDGSSNIDVVAPVGTIWTVFRNPPDAMHAEEAVLQPGAKQVAAGYVLYGSSTVLVYTTGRGVHMFTLDPQFGAFLLTRENIRIPEHKPEYSVNEAYYHSFPKGYRNYLDWAKDRRGERGEKVSGSGGLSMRYIGSLVADFHRILIKGGVFLYPPTTTHPGGKLRLMYEANPLALIAEAAGGAALTGRGDGERILQVQPNDVHDRTPLIIGSRDNVGEVMGFLTGGG